MDLINFGISDGELEKRKAHYLQKAIEEGVDLDELEIYLDSSYLVQKIITVLLKIWTVPNQNQLILLLKVTLKSPLKFSVLKQKNDVFASFPCLQYLKKLVP